MSKFFAFFTLVLAGQAFFVAAADDFYSQCDKKATCFGLPAGCVQAKNCLMVVAILPEVNGALTFETLAVNLEPKQYFAVGLSTVHNMFPASVTACVTWTSNTSVHNSFNPGYRNEPDNITGITAVSTSYDMDNKTQRCTWKRDVVTQTQNMTFDLTLPHYLLLARGQMENETKLTQHGYTDRTLSKSPLNLTQINDDVAPEADKTWLVKIHASFMVIAWIGGISVAILMPRFFKESWKGKLLLGTDPWFAVHRGLMILSVILAKIAFLCIFFKVGGLRFTNLHQYFGLTAFTLMFVQPIMATFRCAGDAKNRWIFNWTHRLVGNLAHLTAIVTICLASVFDLVKSTNFLWTVFSFIAIYILFFALLEFYPLLARRRSPDNLGAETQRIRELFLRVFIVLDIVWVLSLLYYILS